MQSKKKPFIFCNQQWKLAGIVLLILLAITAFGGFYLFDLYEDDEDYEHSEMYWGLLDGQFPWTNNGIATPAMQQKLAATVVGIQSGGDYSSGVMVHPNGYIVSVLHAIKDKKNIKISVRQSNANNTAFKSYKAEVLKQLPEHDIVLIKLLSNERFPYISFSKEALTSNATLYALGSSEAGQFLMHSGNASLNETSITIHQQKLTHLLHSNAVHSWEQNGGPTVNAKGGLMGINLAIKDKQGNIHGLLIPVSILQAHLQDVLPSINKKTSKKTLAAKNQNKLAPAPQPSQPQSAVMQNSLQAEPTTMAVAWWNQARQEVSKARNQPFVPFDPTSMAVATNIAFMAPEHAPSKPLTFLDVGNLHPLKLGSYELNDLLAMLVIGIIAGIMGVVTPLLGALYMLIAMYGAMNYDFFLARPVIFISMCFIYGVITIRYRLDKTADRLFAEHPVILQLPVLIVATTAGFLLANLFSDKMIMFLLTSMVIVVIVNHFYDNFFEKLFFSFLNKSKLHKAADWPNISDQHLEENNPYVLLTREELKEKPSYYQWRNRAISAFPVAFSAGLLAIFNGTISLQAKVNGFGVEKSRATSAQLIFFISLTGTIIALIHGTENNLFKIETPFLLAIILIPPIFGGVFVANRLLQYIDIKIVRLLMILILTAVTALMLRF